MNPIRINISFMNNILTKGRVIKFYIDNIP